MQVKTEWEPTGGVCCDCVELGYGKRFLSLLPKNVIWGEEKKDVQLGTTVPVSLCFLVRLCVHLDGGWWWCPVIQR